MEKWYAVNAKQSHERMAALSLQNLGITTYFPETKEFHYRMGKEKLCRCALFPGYLFAKFDYERQFRMVSYCRGVKKVVAFGQMPAEVDPSLIDELRGSLRQDTIKASDFRAGDSVRICEGPLAGISGRVVASLPRQARVLVLLRFLSSQCRTVVAFSHIEKYLTAV